MGTSYRVAALLLLLSVGCSGDLAADSSLLPCMEYPHLLPIVLLGPRCFGACRRACRPLAEAFALSLALSDPMPVVCANLDTLSCFTGPAYKAYCGPVLLKAKMLGAAVPLSTEELRAMCNMGGTASSRFDLRALLNQSAAGMDLRAAAATTTQQPPVDNTTETAAASTATATTTQPTPTTETTGAPETSTSSAPEMTTAEPATTQPTPTTETTGAPETSTPSAPETTTTEPAPGGAPTSTVATSTPAGTTTTTAAAPVAPSAAASPRVWGVPLALAAVCGVRAF